MDIQHKFLVCDLVLSIQYSIKVVQLELISLRSLDNTALIPALPREPLSREQAYSRNSPFNLADLGHTMSGLLNDIFFGTYILCTVGLGGWLQ